jgi:hypothetical protein
VPINLLAELSDETLYSFTATGGNHFGGEITLSKTDITVAAYATTSVTVTDVLNNADYASYQISNSSVIGCRWGSWSNNNISLGIKGFSPGTATITVRLLDAYDNVLDSAVITVTVTEGSPPAVTFYNSHYPVVDLGAYENVASADHYAVPDNTHYWYYSGSFYGDIDDVITRYGALLMQQGFMFYGVSEVDGYTYYIYTNSDWWVAVGIENLQRYGIYRDRNILITLQTKSRLLSYCGSSRLFDLLFIGTVWRTCLFSLGRFSSRWISSSCRQ